MPSIAPNGTSQYGRGLVEGSWKGMKKYLEQEMLCPELKGRISYHSEVYPKFGYTSACFTLLLDGNVIKRFGFMYAYASLIDQGKLMPGQYLESIPQQERDVYTDDEFSQALRAYRNQPIQTSLQSNDPIVRMFAILDRRVGKRTLARLKDSFNDQPEWLQRLYEARMTEAKL
ncbi:MAG: hypothetical protein IJ418_23785 [Clostridia bacterium]|nr:hypothetical protein [Clostridia bacterium]